LLVLASTSNLRIDRAGSRLIQAFSSIAEQLKSKHVVGGNSVSWRVLLFQLIQIGKFIAFSGAKQNVLVDGASTQKKDRTNENGMEKLRHVHCKQNLPQITN
jgi:hypothetical protein